jgi:hypothetical protein
MTNDRGIDRLIPQYPTLLAADTTFWEAVYDDGSIYSEADGAVYGGIERGRLGSFRLMQGGEILVELFPPVGATGYNLVYRRRTVLSQEAKGRGVVFLVGYLPMGPVFVVDPDAETLVIHDRPDTIAQLDITPHRGEPAGLLK